MVMQVVNHLEQSEGENCVLVVMADDEESEELPVAWEDRLVKVSVLEIESSKAVMIQSGEHSS